MPEYSASFVNYKALKKVGTDILLTPMLLVLPLFVEFLILVPARQAIMPMPMPMPAAQTCASCTFPP